MIGPSPADAGRAGHEPSPDGLGHTVAIPDAMPGHWETLGGAEMAREYATKARSDLCMGHLSDLALANEVFLADRFGFSLIAYQQAAKERIRWLSAQLALARAAQ